MGKSARWVDGGYNFPSHLILNNRASPLGDPSITSKCPETNISCRNDDVWIKLRKLSIEETKIMFPLVTNLGMLSTEVDKTRYIISRGSLLYNISYITLVPKDTSLS